MAGCSKKQYAIMMNSNEGKKLAAKMGGMSQEEFNKAFADLLGSNYSQDDDEDFKEFDADSEDDYEFEEENSGRIKGDLDRAGFEDTKVIDNKTLTFKGPDGKTWTVKENENIGFDVYDGSNNKVINDFNANRGNIADAISNLNSSDKTEEINYDIETDEGWENFKELVHEVAVDNDQNDISKITGDVIGKIIEKGNLPYTEEQVAGFINDMVEEYKSRGYDDDDGDDDDDGGNNDNPMNPHNPKYKGKSRSSITNAKKIGKSVKVHDVDSDEDVEYSIIEYIPYGSLQDGDNKKLYGVVVNYDGSDSPDIGATVSPTLEGAKEDFENQIQLAEEGSERYLKRGKWDEGWFKMLNDKSYDWDDDTRKKYSDKYGWDFNKPWEEQEHVKSTRKKGKK